MKMSKIVALFAFMLMLIPVLKINAEESGAVSAGGEIKTNTTLNREVDGKGRPASGILSPADLESGPTKMPPIRKIVPKPSMDSSAGIKSEGELSDDKKDEIKADAAARKAEIKAKMDLRKGEIKIKLEAKAKERVKALLENIFKKLNGQIEKLSNIDKKIGEKISSLSSSGVDVTAMQAQYVIAQTALAKAKVDVAATSSLSIDQTDASTSKETLRSLVKTAEESIRAAGKEYKKVIPMLERSKVKTEKEKTEVESDSSPSTSVKQ